MNKLRYSHFTYCTTTRSLHLCRHMHIKESQPLTLISNTYIHLASNQPESSSCIHNLAHSSTNSYSFSLAIRNSRFSCRLASHPLDSALPSNTHVHLSYNYLVSSISVPQSVTFFQSETRIRQPLRMMIASGRFTFHLTSHPPDGARNASARYPSAVITVGRNVKSNLCVWAVP